MITSRRRVHSVRSGVAGVGVAPDPSATYAVTQRTAEIGVRMALGAPRRHVLWLVLRRGVAHMIAGLALGLGGAWMLRRVLPNLIAMTPDDAVAVVSVAILLVLVGLGASLQPARRASRVDPVIALRGGD